MSVITVTAAIRSAILEATAGMEVPFTLTEIPPSEVLAVDGMFLSNLVLNIKGSQTTMHLPWLGSSKRDFHNPNPLKAPILHPKRKQMVEIVWNVEDLPAIIRSLYVHEAVLTAAQQAGLELSNIKSNIGVKLKKPSNSKPVFLRRDRGTNKERSDWCLTSDEYYFRHKNLLRTVWEPDITNSEDRERFAQSLVTDLCLLNNLPEPVFKPFIAIPTAPTAFDPFNL